MAHVNSTISRAFCCNSCSGDVALELSQGGELYYICQNSACKRAVHVDCPEALRLKEPEPPSTPAARKAAYQLAQGLRVIAHAGGFLVPSGTRAGVVHFVSADGTCSCEARGACWHQAAVAQPMRRAA